MNYLINFGDERRLKVMSYEYKKLIQERINGNPYLNMVVTAQKMGVSGDELKTLMNKELDHVYREATKVTEMQDEIRKQKGILSGQMGVMEINLNYYKKQAVKADEYEAKAKLMDNISTKLKKLDAETIDSLNVDYYDFGLYVARTIDKYESGESK